MTREPLRILFVTPECAPFAKVGGLADVVGALPKVLRRLGHDARVVLPLYGSIDRAALGVRPDGSACVHMGGGVEQWIGVQRARLEGEVPLWLVDYGAFFGRPGIYGDGLGEYGDNAYRFALLCKAAMQLCKDSGFIPDVMHLHDWPAAPAAALLKTWDRFDSPLERTASVLTIHNIGHQGKYGADAYAYLGLGGEHFGVFEDYGRINLLKGGIRFADAITTVSPTHLAEIRSPDGAHGLAPFLAARGDDLFGVLNGVDYEHWDPATDPYLPARFRPEDLSGKAVCKRTLQLALDLEQRADVPLFGMITRLVLQKGIDLLRDALPALLRRLPLQLAVLGTGEPEHEAFFRWLAGAYPGRVGCHIGYSEELAHLIEGGSDFFLMPSLYEPCGLNQIYSMKYGTLPVVRATGGLQDTVEDHGPGGLGTGFKFHAPTPQALADVVARASGVWLEQPDEIAALRARAMSRRFSWERAAGEYLRVYARARERRASWR